MREAPTLLNDRYELGVELGAGGMGVVYEGVDRVERARVAVKLLKGEASRSLRARFLREARLASQIRHPNAVRVRGYARGHEEQLYLVMDLVEGAPLSRLIDAGLSAGPLVGLLLQVLDALSHVHARSILHRDIKPDNILVSREPESGALRAHLTDFGIAGLLEHERDETRLTQEGATLGTPDYMAPEQASITLHLTPAVDLYPIGVILYAALSRRMPFSGGALAVMVAKSQQETPPPHNLSDWPTGLWSTVQRLLERDPARRPTTAADAHDALAPFASTPSLPETLWRDLLSDATASRVTLSADGELASLGTLTMPQRAERESLWGRERERARIQALAEEAESGALKIALLEGPVGIGKSHIARHIALKLAESGRFQLLQGSYAGLGDHDLRRVLERTIGTTGRPHSEVRPLVTAFLRRFGVEDPIEVDALVRELRPETSPGTAPMSAAGGNALFLRVLRHMMRRQPVVLLLDDVHREPVGFSALVEVAIVDAAYDAFPLLILATRRDDAEPIPRLERHILHGEHIERVTIPPVQEDALAELLTEETGVPWIAARAMAKRSGGNPLFAKLLTERGEDAATSTGEGALPEQLSALMVEQLERRVDALPEARQLREVLGRIAILGAPVQAELLEVFCEDIDVDFDEVIDTLVGAELLDEDHITDTLRFHHPLLGASIREGLTGRKARRHFVRAAELRQERAGERADAVAIRIGDHYAGARRIDDAIAWWRRGLQHELAEGDLQQVMRAAELLLKHLAPGTPERAENELILARAHRESLAYDEAQRILEPLADSDDLDTALEALELLADIAQERSDAAVWRARIEHMEALLPEADVRGRRAYQRAWLFWSNSKLDHSESLDRGRAWLDADLERPDKDYILARMFWSAAILHSGGRSLKLDTLIRLRDEMEALTRTRAQESTELLKVQMLAASFFCDHTKALEINTHMLRLFREQGNSRRYANTLIARAERLLMIDAPERALEVTATLRRILPQEDPPTMRSLSRQIVTCIGLIMSDKPAEAQILSLRELISRTRGFNHMLPAVIWYRQVEVWFAASTGDPDAVLEHMRALPGVFVGWGPGPPEPFSDRIVERLAQLIQAHPERDDLRAEALIYLERMLEECRHVQPHRDDSFILAYFDQIRAA